MVCTQLLVALVVLTVQCFANDPTRSICKEHKNYFTKNPIDNKTEKKFKYSSPKKATKSDITSIYKYDENLQELVNAQILIEMNAFYSYLGMAQYFKRYDQDREGFAKYFKASAMEELEHAEEFMKYQHLRGGKVQLIDIPAPVPIEFRNGKDALKTALALEKNVTDQVLCLHSFAVHRFDDSDFVNLLEEKIIPEQYQSMKELQTHIKTLDRACPRVASDDDECAQYPLYELQFDEMLLKSTKN